jgi:hypothetical protein
MLKVKSRIRKDEFGRCLFLNVDTSRLLWKDLPMLRGYTRVDSTTDGLLVLETPPIGDAASSLPVLHRYSMPSSPAGTSREKPTAGAPKLLIPTNYNSLATLMSAVMHYPWRIALFAGDNCTYCWRIATFARGNKCASSR